MKFLIRLPGWVRLVVFFLVVYLGIDAAMHYVAWLSGVRPHDLDAMIEALQARWLLMACAFYGLMRSAAKHPAADVGYKNWLRLIPWHPGMPLPLGPAMLHWLDGLMLLALAALARWDCHLSPIFPPYVFGCGYCLGSLMPLIKTRQFTEAYVIALAGSALPWLWPWPIAGLTLVAGLVVLAQVGLWRSLSRFPWELADSTELKDPWPLPIYSDHAPRIPTRRGLLVALLIASWVGALVHMSSAQPKTLILWLILGSALGGLLRYGIYYSNLTAPMTLLGRLRAGRVILTNYHHARVAPIMAAMLGSLAPILVIWAAAPLPFAAAITAFGVMAVLLVGGPELRTWQLTGFHRFVVRPAAARGAHDAPAA